jgi:hypothetical protein
MWEGGGGDPASYPIAPGRAPLVGGGSPLLARQGEELAERQGCSGRLEIWRKPQAKRWPDEQEADTRRHGGVRRPISSKPETCTERRDVDPTGISVKVGAQYPGRSGGLPRATDIERCWDGSMGVSRGHSSHLTKWRRAESAESGKVAISPLSLDSGPARELATEQ